MEMELVALDLRGPTTTADRFAIICAFKSELDTTPTIDFSETTVQPTFDRDESERSDPIIVELDIGGTHQVQGVSIPQI
jgi:hypothetical protein